MSSLRGTVVRRIQILARRFCCFADFVRRWGVAAATRECGSILFCRQALSLGQTVVEHIRYVLHVGLRDVREKRIPSGPAAVFGWQAWRKRVKQTRRQ